MRTADNLTKAFAAKRANQDDTPNLVPFMTRIRQMNERYELEVNDHPTYLNDERLAAFYAIMRQELEEMAEIPSLDDPDKTPLDALTALADLLADIIVYCSSEAVRWGIPIEDVLQIVMDSNESKLGEDGRAIKDERGKFLKGPNYWAPEAKIKELLFRKLETKQREAS